ncbi:Pex19 protein family-domain-containing protein [Phyllosticta capitalensis]|uniref:Pex19 protein family-domain-containing protein n=1 Tax=Phyllosticta capitalensis TaxID=121624 RepID=UPI003130A1BA
MADKGNKKEQPPPYPYEEVPDPDEDDLDDLDDVLDEFSATKLEDKPSATSQPSTSGPGRPAPAAAAAEPAASSSGPAVDDEAFAQQLQAGMAELLGELGNNPDMQKQFEDLMKELGEQAAADAHPAAASAAGSSAKPAAATPSAGDAAGSKTASDKKEESFQEQIRRTMERMQASGEQADAAAASSGQDDFLAQMLAEMERGGFSGAEGGEPNDEDFSKMLMGMMEQLTNKEILYEPMKDLDDKFPGWFEKNRSTCGKEDLARYEEQQRCVREIVARFERSEYSDEDTADREYIVERMQKMQAAGSPPPDLVGDDGDARKALGELDAGCPTQ